MCNFQHCGEHCGDCFYYERNWKIVEHIKKGITGGVDGRVKWNCVNPYSSINEAGQYMGKCNLFAPMWPYPEDRSITMFDIK